MRTSEVPLRWATMLAASTLLTLLPIATAAAAAPAFDAGTILSRSKALYGNLHSYADTGTTVTINKSPGAPASTETYTFTTLFLPGRHFLFDSRKQSSGERIIIWANGGDFNSWWSATKVHEDYPQGQGDVAFATASYPTAGTVVEIPSLLFAGAGLQSSISAFSNPQAVGMEDVSGHPCYKISGRVALAYGTGNVASAHNATLWIDKSSLLIRKIFEDSPDDVGTGFVTKTTITFDPQINSKIDLARFNVTIPK